MKNRFKRILCSTRASVETIGVLFGIFVITLFIAGGIEVNGYMSTKKALNQAAEEVLSLMKAEGGFDQRLEEIFKDYCRKKGLDPSKITVYGTPKTVQRGNTVEIRASTTYTFKTLKPTGIGEVTWNVEIYQDGLVTTYFRE